MDFGKLSRWEKVAFWSAIGLLGSMFLPWYVIKAQGVALEDVETGEAFTAWQAFGLIDVLLFALGAAVIALLWAKASSKRVSLPLSLNMALIGLGALATALIGFRAVSLPELGVPEAVLDRSGLEVAGLMVYFALVPAALIAISGWRLIDNAGGSLSAELAAVGQSQAVSDPSDHSAPAKPSGTKAKGGGSSPKAAPAKGAEATPRAQGPGVSERFKGTPSAIEQRMLPEQLQGPRGRIVAAVSAVVIAAGAIAVWELANGGDETQMTAGEGSRSLDSILGESETGETTTESGGFFPEEPDGSSSSPPAASASELGEQDCGDGVAVGPNTTCPFALNVADEYRATGSSEVTAYSPALDRDFVMSCTEGTPTVCRGGDDASVFID